MNAGRAEVKLLLVSYRGEQDFNLAEVVAKIKCSPDKSGCQQLPKHRSGAGIGIKQNIG